MDYAAAVEIFFAPAPADVATPGVVAAATPARRLRDALEPIAMHDVWSASVNAAMAERGLDFFQAYVVGRGAPMGEPTGAVVAAAARIGREAPVNASLVELVHEVERTGRFLPASAVRRLA